MYKRPEFPEDFPEEIKEKIIQMMDEVDKGINKWKPILNDLSDAELTAVALVADAIKDNRIQEHVIEAAANDPEVQKAVLAKLGKTESDLPTDLGDFDISDIIGGRLN